jgi:hypothetical protein
MSMRSLHSGWGYGTPRPFNFSRRSIPTSRPQSPSFHSPYTLPSSVARKSFACHSYENTGGVGVFFPFWFTTQSRADRRFRPCRNGFPNSHGIISFADPHLLNPVISYRYKNHRAWGAIPNIQICKCAVCAFFASRLGLRDIPDGVTGSCNIPTRTISLSPLSATLTRMPISVASKGFTETLSSLDATLTKNRGEEGGTSLRFATRHSPLLQTVFLSPAFN